MEPETCYIGIGSNVGDRAAQIYFAREQLDRLPETTTIRSSDVYETEPIGPVEQNQFLNAVVELRTELEPRELLRHLHDIERRAGRRRTQRWGPRTLDLDLLLYGDCVIEREHEGLIVPHPRMHERWFVLKPLCDLAPDLIHPVLGRSIRELLEAAEGAGGARGKPRR